MDANWNCDHLYRFVLQQHNVTYCKSIPELEQNSGSASTQPELKPSAPKHLDIHLSLKPMDIIAIIQLDNLKLF